MKNIDQQIYDTLFPKNKENIDYLSTLTEEEKENYFRLTALYRTLLNKYVYINGLNEAEKNLIDSDLGFIPIEESAQDFYQCYNGTNMKYYYVRNNIYIERLDKEHFAYLLDKLNRSDYSLDTMAVNFIKDTLKNVINEDINFSENCVTNFGPISSAFFAKPDCLIIGFRYDEFTENHNLDDSQWEENNMKQRLLLEKQNNEVETTISSNLNISTKVIEYDEYSVVQIKKNNEGEKVK